MACYTAKHQTIDDASHGITDWKNEIFMNYQPCRHDPVFGLCHWQLRKNIAQKQEHDLARNQDPWERLQQSVQQCTRCTLHQTRTQTVFGVGDRQADCMLIGEAPGFYEDQQGEPFVGRAGQLLTAMLRSIGLTRQQVYIANILKCRPPNNRDPAPEEVHQCTHFLEQQIHLVRPKLLLALGRFAAHYLLDTKISVEQCRGKVHVYKKNTMEHGVPCMVTYHPAYLLRNPHDKKKACADLLLMQRQLSLST